MRVKIIRTATIALSLDYLLKGQLAFINRFFQVIAISGEDDHLNNVAIREGVETMPLKMQRKISPLNDLKSLWLLYRVFKKEKPQIVHSITPKAGLLSMLAAKIAGVPVRMHTFTGLIFPSKTGLMQKLLIRMDQLLCWAATNVYPEGNGVKNDLVRFNITSKPLKVLANGNVNGIDIEYFSDKNISPESSRTLRQNLGILESDFVFIFVGRLVGDKGVNELVEAFIKICAEVKNVRLLLVGPMESDLDPLKEHVLREVEKNKSIISVGFQKDVRPYFAISDCLAFPSYREGFPNVVMQAGAMGLPAIVTDINGCNEIIVDSKNGIIIPVKDVERLRSAMSKIINDTQLFMNLKRNAREMIVNRYQQDVVWEALLDEYRLLQKKSQIG